MSVPYWCNRGCIESVHITNSLAVSFLNSNTLLHMNDYIQKLHLNSLVNVDFVRRLQNKIYDTAQKLQKSMMLMN